MLDLQIRIILLALLALGFMPWSAPSHADTWGAMLDAAWQRQPESHTQKAQGALLAASARDARRWWPEAPALSVAYRSDDAHGEWEAELEAPLWRNGQREAQARLATISADNWNAQQALLRWLLAGNLRDAVWTLVARESERQLARERLITAETLAADVARRVAAGELAHADALLAESETLAARNDVDEAALQWLQALQQLELLAGHAHLPVPLLEPAKVIVEIEVDQHPQVRAAAQALAVAQAEAGVARSRQTPMSGALLWSQTHETLDSSHQQQVGVKLTLPLGAEGRQRATIANAQRKHALALARVDISRREATQQIQWAKAALNNANRQRQQAEQQYHLAQQSLMLSQRAFDAGELDLVSMLRLQQMAQQAHSQRESKRIASERAVSVLNQAWGVLP